MTEESKFSKLAAIPANEIRTAARCPVCKAAVEPKYRPFCSKRCADVDLGRWFKESYRIPTDEGPGDGSQGEDEDY